MTVIEEMLGNAERYAEAFDKGGLPMPPAKHVAVVACMDARLTRKACSASRKATPTWSGTPGASSPTT
jgi:carbonic anhydrase